MSDPIINRWGLNLFWYRLWFNDWNPSINIHQDSLINKLVQIFINYGLSHYKNLFLNKRFFPHIINNYKNFLHDHAIKYTRLVEHKNKTTGENRAFQQRLKAKNLFCSKLWILRYQNWLILNFYFFQPLKPRRRSLNRFKTPLDGFSIEQRQATRNIFVRNKFLIARLLSFATIDSKYYKF
jgi:hypothetical protein